jgi:hypothetical protein
LVSFTGTLAVITSFTFSSTAPNLLHTQEVLDLLLTSSAGVLMPSLTTNSVSPVLISAVETNFHIHITRRSESNVPLQKTALAPQKRGQKQRNDDESSLFHHGLFMANNTFKGFKLVLHHILSVHKCLFMASGTGYLRMFPVKFEGSSVVVKFHLFPFSTP